MLRMPTCVEATIWMPPSHHSLPDRERQRFARSITPWWRFTSPGRGGVADPPDRAAALALGARMDAEIARLDARDDEAGRITGVGIWQFRMISGKVIWSAEIYRI